MLLPLIGMGVTGREGFDGLMGSSQGSCCPPRDSSLTGYMDRARGVVAGA